MKHLAGALVLVAVLTAATIGLFNAMNLLPVQASVESLVVDDLMNLQLYIIAFLAALICGFMLYSVVVFRRRSPDDDGDGQHIHGHAGLEIVWTVVPLVFVMWLAYHSMGELNEVVSAKSDEIVVNVTGEQWQWVFEYPEQNVTSSTLVLPIDRTALLQITSKDVLHSFWVVEFRLKQDAVPGIVRPLRVTPNRLGEYRVRCAEICGAGHTNMIQNMVLVVDEEDFEAELDAAVTGANLSPVERGAKIASDRGCVACHSVDGTKVIGPTWLDLVGTQEQLADGTTVTVDAEYIRRSILDPGAQLVEGYLDVMPKTFADTLTAEDIDAIIAYMTSLSSQADNE